MANTKTLKQTPGYIRRVKEAWISLSAEHKEKGVPKHGIHSLAKFSENLGYEHKEVRDAVISALKSNLDECEFDGWTISWMSTEEWRNYISQHGIKIATPFMCRIYGKIPANPNGFATEDRPFGKKLHDFMSR